MLVQRIQLPNGMLVLPWLLGHFPAPRVYPLFPENALSVLVMVVLPAQGAPPEAPCAVICSHEGVVSDAMLSLMRLAGIFFLIPASVIAQETCCDELSIADPDS